jgi:hypothetical protein
MKVGKNILFQSLKVIFFATNQVENALNLEGPVTLSYPVDRNMEDIFFKKPVHKNVNHKIFFLGTTKTVNVTAFTESVNPPFTSTQKFDQLLEKFTSDVGTQ